MKKSPLWKGRIKMPELFKNRYRSATTRAQFHDYNGGMYFVTICVNRRIPAFGVIARNANGENELRLSPLGQYADQCIAETHLHNTFANVPLWVVMPDHIHLIVSIDVGNDTNRPLGNNYMDDSRNRSISTNENRGNEAMYNIASTDGGIDEKMQRVSRCRGTLSTVVGGMKRAITMYARQNNIPFNWQTRFYDRIIRNADEMNRIAEYIEKNVSKWGVGNDDF